MDEVPNQTVSWSLAMTLAAIGAFLAVVGVFLGWFAVTAVRQTEIFGREIVRSETHTGTGDITGIVVAVIGGLIGVLALAALVVGSEEFRRFVASFATFGGVALVAASGLGYARVAMVAQGTGVAVGRMTFEGTASFGLYVSAVAGAVTAVAGLLALRTRT
jgi:hypothetical protein